MTKGVRSEIWSLLLFIFNPSFWPKSSQCLMLQVAKEVRNLKHAACIQQSKLANLPGYATRVVHWHLLDGPPLLTFGRSNDIYHNETTWRLRKLDAASWGPEKSYMYHLSILCILHPALYAVEAMPSWGPWCSQLARWFLHMRNLNGWKQPTHPCTIPTIQEHNC